MTPHPFPRSAPGPPHDDTSATDKALRRARLALVVAEVASLKQELQLQEGPGRPQVSQAENAALRRSAAQHSHLIQSQQNNVPGQSNGTRSEAGQLYSTESDQSCRHSRLPHQRALGYRACPAAIAVPAEDAELAVVCGADAGDSFVAPRFIGGVGAQFGPVAAADAEEEDHELGSPAARAWQRVVDSHRNSNSRDASKSDDRNSRMS